MRAIVLVVLLAAPQDAGEIKKQIDRIGPNDPQSAFDAVGRLADLAGTSKAEVEAAAAKIPDDLAFYRKLLQDEIASRQKLGDRFGKAVRVSLDVKEKSIADVLTELTEQAKEKVDTTYAMRGAAPQPVTLKIEDATYLAALAKVCGEAKWWINPTLDGITVYQGGREALGISAYRNFLIMIQSAERMKRTKFGEGTKSSMTLRVTGLWDSQAGVIQGREPKLIEAIDDKGRALEPMARDEDEDPTRDENAVENGIHGGSYGDLRFKQPEKDAEKLARVRGSIAFLVPVKSVSLSMAFKDGKAEAASNDVAELSLVQMEGGQQVVQGGRGIWFRSEEMKIRVKPKGSIDDLKKMPISFSVKIKDAGELKASGYGRVVDGAIEYQLWPNYPPAQRFNQDDNGRAYEGVSITIHTEVIERTVGFEFRDVPLK